MSGYRPITRSRARDGGFGYQNSHETSSKNIPPPLNIRKDTVRQHVDTTSIGLAMGSPRDNPLPPTPHAPPAYSDTFTLPPSTNGRFMVSENVHEQLQRDSKPKGTRWKNFGSLFGKKDGSTRAEASVQQQIDPSAHSKPSQLSAAQNSMTRKRAGSDKEKAMESQKSMAGRQVGRGPSLLRRTSTRRKAGARRKPGDSRQETSRTRAAGVGPMNRNSPSTMTGLDQQIHHKPHAQAFSLLQVEIPNIELERYSVMFGNVLVPGLKSGSKTSLLHSSPGILEEAEPACDLSVAVSLFLYQVRCGPGLTTNGVCSLRSLRCLKDHIPESAPIRARGPNRRPFPYFLQLPPHQPGGPSTKLCPSPVHLVAP